MGFVKPEPNRQTSPCAGQRHQTSRSAGETSHDTARELEPSHALEEDDGNGESNANTGVALVWRGSQMWLRKKEGSRFHIV